MTIRDGIASEFTAAFISNCINFTLDNSLIANNTATTSTAGVVLVNTRQSGASSMISGCEFVNNTSHAFTALLADMPNVTISNSRFVSNKALQGDGGAIYFGCSSECKYSVASTEFIGNYAALNGGAIAWSVEPAYDNSHSKGTRLSMDLTSLPTESSFQL
mmetsp:Transcript_20211/g.37687  ORF Transcript_20211/g.37687 Transcript_20211/m.37687 type:complete len:161 (-) Transcript_20211:242-724(-)